MTANNQQRAEKLQRVGNANEVLRVMGANGRRVFFAEKSGKVSQFSLGINGVIWLTDAQTQALVYVASSREWRGFSFDAPARQLVEDLCLYIRTGEPISANWFESWAPSGAKADHWRYGPAALAAVRVELARCDAIALAEAAPLAA